MIFMKHLLSILFLTSSLMAADPLPANRTPAHTGSWVGIAGVPGGIPKRYDLPDHSRRRVEFDDSECDR
jgi:hypothetical protein